MALAESARLDGSTVIEILSQSAAGSWMLGNRGPRMVKEDPPVTSAVDFFVKAVGIVLAPANKAKLGLPLSALARQMFLQASGMGLDVKTTARSSRSIAAGGIEGIRRGASFETLLRGSSG